MNMDFVWWCDGQGELVLEFQVDDTVTGKE